MKRPAALFILTAFTLWILPLGAFIKKGEEYRTCGGKRAFHMCCEKDGKIRTDSSVPVAFSTASAEKSVPSNSSGTDGYTAAQSEGSDAGDTAHFFQPGIIFNRFILDRSIDHPPQLSPLA